MSSSKGTTFTVRLAPPVLWGDSQDTVWQVINGGPGNYYIKPNNFDTNGTIQKFYWNASPGLTGADSTSADSEMYNFNSALINTGFPYYVYGRDSDGLLRGNVSGNPFVVFADSVPPTPVVAFSINASGGIINWRGKDTKDGNQTQYEILFIKATTDPVEPTNIISAYKAGANYSAATVGGFDFSYTVATQGPGEYHCQVIAKDARGSIAKSTVAIQVY